MYSIHSLKNNFLLLIASIRVNSNTNNQMINMSNLKALVLSESRDKCSREAPQKSSGTWSFTSFCSTILSVRLLSSTSSYGLRRLLELSLSCPLSSHQEGGRRRKRRKYFSIYASPLKKNFLQIPLTTSISSHWTEVSHMATPSR